MSSTRLSTPEDYATLIDRYDTFLFDCDGVLWSGDHIIEGVIEVLGYLRSKGKKTIFVTNNATKSRQEYKGKFDKLGVEVTVDEIFGSAFASAVYISQVLKLPSDQKVYLIGQSGLETELDALGINHIGGTDPSDNGNLPTFSLSTFEPDPAVSVVLAGLDTAINYTKMAKAMWYLRNKEGCVFLASNSDSTYPVKGGLLPGAGAVMAGVIKASGREPISIGKPGRTMMDCIKAKHDFDPARTIMVGDRLDTDIQFGINGGIHTLLVLTGVSKASEVEPGPDGRALSPILPTYILGSFGDLAVLAK